MRVLITGANGLLGQKLVSDFSSSQQVLGIDLSEESFLKPSNFSYQKKDITKKEELKLLFEDFQPNVVINSAAYTDVDGCEINKELAWAVNVEGVRNLVQLCPANKSKLVHFSTDYVFDGGKGPYSEDDPTHPKSFYGETKLESEKIVISSGVDFLIIRTNVLYGTGINVKKNFFLWLYEKLSLNHKIRVVTDQFNNPTLADNLSSATKELTERKASRIFHIAGNTYLSRYDFAMKVAQVFKFDEKNIIPAKTVELKQKAFRPLKGGLKIDKAKAFLKSRLWGVEESLEFLINEM
jgi:dTDP-4-dehydrorhamnose reductase